MTFSKKWLIYYNVIFLLLENIVIVVSLLNSSWFIYLSWVHSVGRVCTVFEGDFNPFHKCLWACYPTFFQLDITLFQVGRVGKKRVGDFCLTAKIWSFIGITSSSLSASSEDRWFPDNNFNIWVYSPNCLEIRGQKGAQISIFVVSRQ